MTIIVINFLTTIMPSAQNITRLLHNLGLSEGESGIYLAGLRLGPARAIQIAEEAQISRTLTYHLLKLLQKKGLVSTVRKKQSQHFVMEPPRQLGYLIDRKRNDLDQMKEQLDAYIPTLESIVTSQTPPSKIRFYEGIEGTKTVVEDTLDSKDKILYSYAAIDNIFAVFGRGFLETYSKQKAERGIHAKSIWSKSLPKEKVLRERKLSETKIAPALLNLQVTIVIYDNKVAVFSPPKKLFAFVVESEEFAQTMKSLFEMIWKSID